MRKKVGISIFKVCLSFVLAVSLCPALSFAEDLSDNVEPDPEDTSNSTVIAGLGNASDTPSAEDSSGEASNPGDNGMPFPGDAEGGQGEGGEAAGPSRQPDTDVDPGAPEPPRETPLADGSYVVLPACSSARVLDVTGGSSADGADVRLWASNMSGAQRVVARADAETGLYELSFAGTGKALDVSGASTAAGTNVQQWSRNGTAAQRWAVSANADGTYSVESALAGGLSLDVSGAGDYDGVELDVWPSNGTAAQRFEFLPAPARVEPCGRTVDDGVYALTCAASGKALDVSCASRADGASVQQWSHNGTMAQMFRVQLGSDGFYSVRALHSGKALDSDLGNVVPGAKVVQWADCGTSNQRWRVDVAADGSWTLVNAASGLALDVAGASAADGAGVQTWTPNGTAAQSWKAGPVESLLPEGFALIRSGLAGGRVLDVAGGSAASGANAQTWSWNGTPAQRWLVKSAGDGLVTLESLCSGMLLTAEGGTALLRPADGSASQLWRAVPSDAGGVSLVSEAAGRALDVSGAGDWDGADAQTWTPNGTAAQSWVAEWAGCVGAGTYEVLSAADGRALDVSSGSRADGANVQFWSANDSGAQKWELSDAGGAWELLNCRSGKALDVYNWGWEDGTNVQQWSRSGSTAQRWRVEYAGGGAYRLVNEAAGKPLDESGAGGWDGANAQVWTDNGTAAQRFRLVPTTYTPPVTGAVQRGDGSWDWYNDDGDWDRSGAINKILSTANSLLGVPYVWLGVYPQDGGMDCASFTWYLYRQLGIDIGFEAYDQMYSGVPVWSLSDAKPGDLILMYDNGWPNYVPGLFEHVVLYAGNGMIYEEPTFGGQCQYVSIWSKGMGNISIRRILGD